MRRSELQSSVLLLAALVAGCHGMRSSTSPAPTPTPTPAAAAHGAAKASSIRSADHKDKVTDETLMKATDAAAAAAAAERAKWREKGFEEFARSVYRDPEGKYIVNGDTTILDRKHLKDFYDENVAKEPPRITELTLATQNGQDTAWNSTAQKQITYCVSSTFATHQPEVTKALADATHAWQGAADVRFTHIAAEDAQCTPSNTNVVFDVRPVNVNGEYLARAFFPNEPRAARNVLIDDSSFDLGDGKLKLVGILRHELGHTLGLRHEHTRPEAGACFEDSNWRPLTDYDKFSVMHYPQCNGGGDWELNLTARDQSGIACAYSPAPGFQIDTTLITNPARCRKTGAPAPATTARRVYRNQRVAKNAEKAYPAFAVRPGSRFDVAMTGRGTSPGDPDLYVRFKNLPTVSSREWDCRPYLDGPAEACSLDVPA